MGGILLCPIIFLLCLIIWLCSSNHELKKEIIESGTLKITTKTEVNTVVKTDTVRLTETFEKPEPIKETFIRTDTILRDSRVLKYSNKEYI